MLNRERRRQRTDLWIAALSAGGAAAAACLLLGLSGWFLTGAAIAGAAGPAVVAAFNYLLPSAAIRFLAISRTGLRYTERLFGHAAALKALAEIRPALFAGIAAAPAARSLRLSSGEATSRLVQDVDALQDVFIRAAAPWAALAALAAASAMIALASPAALAPFLAAFCAEVALGAWIGRVRSRAPGAEALAAAGALKDQLQAFAGASAELRCYGLAGAAIDHLMTLDDRLGEAKRRCWGATAEMSVLQPALAGLAVTGVLLLCLRAPPALAALAALSAGVALESAGALLAAMDRSGAVAAAGERLDALLGPAAACIEPPSGPAWIDLDLGGARRRLSPGEHWLLAGVSGCGKTRVLESLLCLRDVPPGHVRIGCRDIGGLDPAWPRSLFSHAPQDARLICGTVRDNLRLADPAADDDAMWRALARTQLDRKIAALPQSLDTWVGDGGARLSGGEQRRLSLARALLRPAAWLLLDEPTENLDAESEARVVEGLRAHLEETGQGLILVSHRAAAQALADHRLDLDAPARSPTRDAKTFPVLR
jgi:ATP-binding cassette subfamily C protein CydC